MAPSEQEWRELLRDCDFAMARKEIAKVLRGEDLQKLGDSLASQGLHKVIVPFLDTPSLETAIALLQVAPELYSYFDASSPGGSVYFFNKYLDDSGPR